MGCADPQQKEIVGFNSGYLSPLLEGGRPAIAGRSFPCVLSGEMLIFRAISILCSILSGKLQKSQTPNLAGKVIKTNKKSRESKRFTA